MPSSLPFDPSICLGNLVSQKKLDVLKVIATAQARVDTAKDALNSLIKLSQSIKMTMSELIDLDIDVTDLQKNIDQTKIEITAAAVEYTEAKIIADRSVMDLKKPLKALDYSFESPTDWVRSKIESMPMPADSMKINVHYFAKYENDESGASHTASVSDFVSDEVNWMGEPFSAQATSTVQNAVLSKVSKHDIVGTLVLSISCTPKVASVFAPYVLDVDKAIRMWNKMELTPQLDNSNQRQMLDLATELPKQDEPSLNIVTGAAYGSCFIGMVHILNNKNSPSHADMHSLAVKMQAQIKLSMMVENEAFEGGFFRSSADDIKGLLSTQNITSHSSVVAVGLIPWIESNFVAMAVKMYANDPADSFTQLANAQKATAALGDLQDSSAEAVRTGNQLVMINNAHITAALSALKDGDNTSNNIADTGSMLAALDDYIQKAMTGNLGVPIMYFLKSVSAPDLAQSWVAKYFPGKFLAPAGDDTTSKPDAFEA